MLMQATIFAEVKNECKLTKPNKI